MARNIILFSDGSMAFAGNTRRINSFSFINFAMFLFRTDPFATTSDYSCIYMASIPDNSAFGYNDNQGDFIDAINSNPNIRLFSTRMLNI